MASTTSPALPADQDPISKVESLVRSGRIPDAMTELGINASSISEGDFLSNVGKLIEIRRLIQQKQIAQVAPILDSMRDFLTASENREMKLAMSFLFLFSDGFRRLQQGDGQGALTCFESATQLGKQVSLVFPGADELTAYGRAAGFVALAKSQLNRGDIAGAELAVGQAINQYAELKQILQSRQGMPPELILEAASLQVELHLLIGWNRMMLLQFEECKQHLEAAAGAAMEIQLYLPRLQEGPMQRIETAMLLLYGVAQRTVPIAENFLLKSAPLSHSALTELGNSRRDLFLARQHALRAGEQGQGIIATIDQIGAYLQAFATLGAPRFEQWLPVSGIASAVTFLILIFMVRFVIEPPGLLWFPYFLGCLIAALITGFGYGALRFVPLLGKYKEILAAAKEKGESAGGGNADG
jgi:hypothetical protein